MARVVLEGVNKTYPDGFAAVKHFDLDIADQEFVVFVGPSGCGKSTTLRMIAGLEEISGGTLRIGDRVANDLPPKERDIAMVFQNYALYPHMTVAENMAFGLTLRKVPKTVIAEKVKAAAKLLGLESMLERKPKALSGGQRQRVAVGRAIVRDPKCFLFDEPLSNLDARLRVEMRAEIKKLHLELRSTTVYVTHDQEEAMTLGDRVVVMRDGVIQQAATPLDVYRHPANRFVAGFLGTPPMNFLDGKLVAQTGGLWFEGGFGLLRVPEWARAQLASFAGQAAVLGVRPQALSETPFAGIDGPGTTVEARVQIVEHLGDKMDVRFASGGADDLVAHLDASQTVHPGQTLRLFVDLERVHFFAADEDGRALARRAHF